MIRIDSYERCQVDPEVIRNFTLDNPTADFDPACSPCSFLGWIVGANEKVEWIEIKMKEDCFKSIPVAMGRPDVRKLYPDNPAGDKVGFSAYFNPWLLPSAFELDVYAVLVSGLKIRLYRIGGKRRPLKEPSDHQTAPLLVTTLGRTGSTLLISLLGAHPEILAYRPFQAEARYVSYWMQIFLSLSEPKSWIYPISANERSDPGWVFGGDLNHPVHFALYPRVFEWFHGPYMDRLFEFCVRSLKEHYKKVGEIQNKPLARLFCEKFLPDPFTKCVRDLMPDSREVFLVRDFRDMFCSIRAFNEKRGFLGFGREKFRSDREYISIGGPPTARMLLDAWRERKHSSVLIKYEELVMRPKATLKTLFGALGLDASDAVIGDIIQRVDGMVPESQGLHKTVQRAANSVGRFRRDLDPDLLQLCNEAFREGLEAFGYQV